MILPFPSDMQFSMPDWRGDIRRVGGAAVESLSYVFKAAINPLNVIADPVGKGVGEVSEETKKLFQATTGGITDVLGGLSSGAKWAGFIVIAGLSLYILAVVGPFLPKPKGSNA